VARGGCCAPREKKMLALGFLSFFLRLPPAAMVERWPQVCRVEITIELLLTISMKCLVKWIPLNMHVRFYQTARTVTRKFLHVRGVP